MFVLAGQSSPTDGGSTCRIKRLGLLARVYGFHQVQGQIFTSDTSWNHSSRLSCKKVRAEKIRILCCGFYLEVYVLFVQKTDNHYTWRKVTTTVNNMWVCWAYISFLKINSGNIFTIFTHVSSSSLDLLLNISMLIFNSETLSSFWILRFFSIVGKLWIDQAGDMEIKNHKTGDICMLKYSSYSYFSRDTPRKVGQSHTDYRRTVSYRLEMTLIIHQSDIKTSPGW